MAAYEVYLVGGAVRDFLLGLPIKERDWVVVGATAEQMLQEGFKKVGKDFPVFLHPKTKEEYALARLERKVGVGYYGFQWSAEPTVTLEQDLIRRDLTINAIAMEDNGEIIDPLGGQYDLANKVLRHTSEAFIEDPVRILRCARFAARFAELGFVVATETTTLMQEMVLNGEIDSLVTERVWREMQRALLEKSPSVFFVVLRSCNALERIWPELDNLWDSTVSIAEKDVNAGIHTMLAMDWVASLTNELDIRFAVLCHSLNILDSQNLVLENINERELVASGVKEFCDKFNVASDLKELACLVVKYHMYIKNLFDLSFENILQLIYRLDLFRRPERLTKFLLACEAHTIISADAKSGLYAQANVFKEYCNLVMSIKAKTVKAENPKLIGKKFGEALYEKRLQILISSSAD